MATISVYKSGTTHYHRNNAKVPYVAEWVVDLAKVAEAKGSAIAAADVIEAIYVPAGTQVLFAGLQVKEPLEGTVSVATLDLGITGGDVDAFVDGFDAFAAVAGDFAAPAAAAVTPATLVTTADTIDILIATQTGTITGGKIRVFATLLDVTEVPAPGIAKPGS